VSFADVFSIGQGVTRGSECGHFAGWHTGHGETLKVVLSPGITCLVHHAIVLTIHALGSLALALLAEVDDGDHGLGHVDLDLVVRVGHGAFPRLL